MTMESSSNTKMSIDELQARGDHFTRQLIKEKQRFATLLAEREGNNIKIADFRESNKQKAMSLLNKYTTTPNDSCHRVDGLNPSKLAEENQKKKVKQMESTLDKALLKQGDIHTENEAIKFKIDELRRKIYNNAKNKERMEKELVDVKDDVEEMLKRATIVATERERLVDRRQQVLQHDNEKQKAFNKEYNEVCLLIAKQAESLAESVAKAADSVAAQLSISDRGMSSPGPDNVDDTKRLEDKIAALDLEYEATQSNLRDVMQKIQDFEDKFKELRAVSELSSIDDIVSTFTKNEDERFSMFNYIQSVNNDCDKTMEHAAKVREEIKKYRTAIMSEESSRSATMNIYKDSLQEVERERAQLSETAIEVRRTIESISHRMTALFFKLKCHELKGDEEREMAPKNGRQSDDRKLANIGGGEVSEQNILNLMELIETRSIQIVEAFENQMAASKRSRRHSLILVSCILSRTFDSFFDSCIHSLVQSPTMFSQAIANVQRDNDSNEDVSSDKSGSEAESSDDGGDEGFQHLVSLNDIRREEGARVTMHHRATMLVQPQENDATQAEQLQE